uniref:Mediator complex subunit 15 KIX domain-containing protein n=1 Tax=Fagus sylvatica TaxID=28930 RepID=A0A2N9GK05_FAGSY
MSFSDPCLLNGVTNTIAQVEENEFRNATTKDGYMQRIAKKMALIDSIGSSSRNFVSSSNQGTGISGTDATGHSSSLQNVSEVAYNIMRNSVGDRLQSSIATTKGEMSASQHQPQQLQNHILKHKIQEPNINYNHHHPQKQQIVSQPIQHQQIQQQSSATPFKWNHQLRPQRNVLKQQKNSLSQRNKSNTFQQPFGLRSNVSEVPQLEKVVAPQSNVLNLQSPQLLAATLPPVEVTAAQHEVQQLSQPIQFQQLQGSQKKINLSEEAMPQRLQTSAVLLQTQNIIDQQKLIESHRVFQETSRGSSAPTELTNAAQYDQTYQELQSVRKKCLEDLERFQKTTVEMFPQRHTQRLQLSGDTSQASKPQHNKNLRPLFPPVNLPSTSTPPIGLSPLSAIEQGFPNSQPMMINSLQSGSQARLERRNVFSPLQHDSTRSKHQTITSSSKQTNFSHYSSLNTLDSTRNSFPQSSTITPLQQQKQQQMHQMMQPQNFKQQNQPQWIQQRKEQVFMQDAQPSVSSGLLQHHHSIDSLHQTQPPGNPLQFYATSPQMYQSSSPQVNQRNLGSPLSKDATVLQSATSPFITASPSTPLTPSSAPVDLEKHPSSVSPLSNSENIGQTQAPVVLTQLDAQTQIQTQFFSNDSPGISVSPLLVELVNSDCNQQTAAPKQPLEHLLKAPKSELWDEIKCINQQLVETVIDVDSAEDVVTTKAGEGTVIRFSYSAVALSQNFKLHYASSQMYFLIWLLVPPDYPNSSPIIFDGLTVSWRHDSKESKDLSQNAKLRFSRFLLNLSEPMSLGEMARTWDSCARAVFSEHAQHFGGECFSSRYGSWENCSTG